MDKYLKKAKSYSLSNSDIYKAIGINPIRYNDLYKYKTLNDIFNDNGDYIIILYELENQNSGHWVSLYRKDSIEYFDPYGNSPDYYIYLHLHHDNEQIPYLSLLLNKEKKEIIYNNNSLQLLDNSIATCARWNILRYLMRTMDLNEFIRLFSKKKYSISSDDLSVLMTTFLF